MVGLHRLYVSCLDANLAGIWPLTLITENLRWLDKMTLGFESRLAESYAKNEPWSDVECNANTVWVGAIMKNEYNILDESEKTPLSLLKLKLHGLDLPAIIEGSIAVVIDLTKLRFLVLYSCGGLGEAFALLRVKDNNLEDTPGMTESLKHLTRLKLRHERTTPLFQSQLETFLATLPPLFSLQVLLEGCSEAQVLQPILKVHGKSLEVLVWDERRRRRSEVGQDTAVMLRGHAHLEAISSACPNLNSLGLSLDWHGLSNSEACRKAVRLDIQPIQPYADSI